jgi:hypothetical protein
LGGEAKGLLKGAGAPPAVDLGGSAKEKPPALDFGGSAKEKEPVEGSLKVGEGSAKEKPAGLIAAPPAGDSGSVTAGLEPIPNLKGPPAVGAKLDVGAAAAHGLAMPVRVGGGGASDGRDVGLALGVVFSSSPSN